MITIINKFFENIADAIPQINDFGYGVLTNDKNIKDGNKYPMLWVNNEFRTSYNVTQVNNKVMAVTYDFNLWLFDRWGENQDSPQEAKITQLSNCEQIAQMVIILASQLPQGGVVLNPFVKVEFTDGISYIDIFANRLVATSVGCKITMKSQDICEFTQLDINNVFNITC